VGYDAQFGAFTVTPEASALYTLVGLEGYDETGSLAPLHINSQNESSLRSRLGVNASYKAKVGDVSVTPSVAAQWEHEYLNNELGLDASFGNGAGTDFRVNGPEMGRDSILISAGVNISWSRYAAYVAYQADLGRTNYNSQIVLVGLRVTW